MAVNLLRLAPYLAILGLLFAVAFIRGDKIKAEAKAAAAVTEAKALREVNKQNANSFTQLAQSQRQNDALVQDLHVKVSAIKLREVNTRQAIKEVYRNDPVARDWSAVSIPGGVQRALNGQAVN